MERGRPKKPEVNNFNFDELKYFFSENKKEPELNTENLEEPEYEETDEPEDQPEQVETNPPNGNVKIPLQIEKETEQPDDEDEYIDTEGFIAMDKNTIKLADAVMSSFLETGLNYIGFKKEIKLMTNEETKFFEKNLPPLKFKRNWKNIFLIYLFTKLK